MTPSRRKYGLQKTLGAVLAMMACLGCGGTYDSYVSGLATLDGTPLTRGTVTFMPDGPGPTAYGSIDGEGYYTVKTGREEGLPPGQYTVTIVAKEDSIPDTSGRGMPPKAGKNITPLWYASKNSSGLNFTVESGSNDINLELSSEPPPDWKPAGKRRRR